ncbi:MAG: TIGR02996 domain-containing protein [Planctomycetia bacterium]|nr:TIGR02996 domain-containing protein [Planctomycetia bacterium]
MSDEAALLSAIRANPEEDTPRLLYADWLEEQGGESNEARAEYIRLEIQFAIDFPERQWSKEKEDARKRARQLFAKYYREWFPELFGKKNILRGARAGWHDMDRGFLYKLQCDYSKILKVGERLTQHAPITEFQLLDVTTSGLEEFMRVPWTRRLRKVGLGSEWGSIEPNYESLADGTHFAELRDLAICDGWLDTASAKRIATAKLFPKLERFYFGSYSTDEAPAALFSGKTFTGLRNLDLSGGGSSPSDSPMPGLKQICESRTLKSLKSFNMGWRPTKGLAEMLTKSTFWRGLEELDLLRNNLNNDDLATFLNTPSKLRILKLNDNKITAKGAKMLAEHPAFAKLTTLDLSSNKIGDTGFAAVVKSPNARNLRKLEVSDCGFGLAGITALAESPYMANLRELWMSSNDIDLKGAKLLAESPHLANIEFLYLGSGLTPTAKKALKAKFGNRVSL